VSSEDFPELLRRAKAGDEAAFAELFRATQPIVIRYLASMAPPGMVDDVAAEAWVSVIRALSKFDDDEPGFRAWVLTMARRRWVDEVRRRSRRPESLTPTETLTHLSDGSSVEAEVDDRLSQGRAMSLLRLLPPDQAEVVMLRSVSGLDIERVAAIVGKKPGAVRVLSHRGLKKLAALLSPELTKNGPEVTNDGPASVKE
jgi:RNA polymerase sigma-70 factor (ECF subfamily)